MKNDFISVNNHVHVQEECTGRFFLTQETQEGKSSVNKHKNSIQEITCLKPSADRAGFDTKINQTVSASTYPRGPACFNTPDTLHLRAINLINQSWDKAFRTIYRCGQ